jgi:hypothetical protein
MTFGSSWYLHRSQSRLVHVQTLRCAAEIEFLGDGHEGLQRFRIE